MPSLDQKISAFIENHFPDIDYSILGSNENSEIHKMALNYEYFVNSIEYYNFQKEINAESVKQISTGNLRGIDGCFFVINNLFFYVPDFNTGDDFAEWKMNFDETINKSPRIDVQFVFLQSKSSKTELDKFRGFCAAVYDVFSREVNDLSNHPKVETIKYVFSKISQKEHIMRLSLRLCAIQKDSRTITNLLALPDWIAVIEREKRDLKSTTFSEVSILIKSGQEYQEKLEAILSPNQRIFPVTSLKERFVEIPISRATCFIGYLNLHEMKNLLDDGNEQLDDVFFDNIRYFEGYESKDSVNTKIYKSLGSNSDIFHLLHNGITLTAHSKHFNPDNGNLEIKAFSIINGCQTSNIIWDWIKKENKTDAELANIKLPVKIIISSDNNLRALITETANSQNDVKSIQLVAVSEEAKSLQVLFDKEIRLGERLYYERLSNQYPDITKTFKLLTTDVFRGFYASFGKSPHKLTVGYGSFEKEMLQRKDFLGTNSNGNSKYDIKTYFVSAVLYNYLERFLRSKYSTLISLKHHFLLLLFISIDKDFDLSSENYKVKLPDNLYSTAIALVSKKDDFEERTDKICKIAINKLDFFIEKINNKPKVLLKSYYTEDGTTKMIEIFKRNFNWN